MKDRLLRSGNAALRLLRLFSVEDVIEFAYSTEVLSRLVTLSPR